MVDEDGNEARQRAKPTWNSTDSGKHFHPIKNGREVTGILDERIENLREAIAEIDAALPGRKQLSQQFLEQIDREAEEARRDPKTLKEPWQWGFYPEVEFMRLSLHKSLTSRAKERRGEELKYWENGVNLAKERRKFLGEYKALIATRLSLRGT
ncbi:MAG TPA: hypothetical protein VMZ31_20330 [Phycisphaerae bacterium]|nr:hypothetical protein [Phycisphaerae bacterium]